MRISPPKKKKHQRPGSIVFIETSDIFKEDKYRDVVYTDKNTQIAYQTLEKKLGEEVPFETHTTSTQIISVKEGILEVSDGKQKSVIYPGKIVIVPQGTRHRLRPILCDEVKICTFYSPPVHGEYEQQERQ